MENSRDWIQLILDKLFAAESRRLDARISELNQRNSEIKKKVLYGFMHMGKRYIPKEYRAQAAAMARQPMPTLAFELISEANAFQTELNRIKLDRDQIGQVLFKLLYQCTTLQEVRDSLPDCVANMVPDLAKLNRYMRDPTWIIRNDDRAIRQYNKMLPKIEMYAMSHLLY